MAAVDCRRLGLPVRGARAAVRAGAPRSGRSRWLRRNRWNPGPRAARRRRMFQRNRVEGGGCHGGPHGARDRSSPPARRDEPPRPAHRRLRTAHRRWRCRGRPQAMPIRASGGRYRPRAAGDGRAAPPVAGSGEARAQRASSWRDRGRTGGSVSRSGTRPSPVSRSLHRLRERGIVLALDDVGTGFSSLVMLRDLPVLRAPRAAGRRAAGADRGGPRMPARPRRLNRRGEHPGRMPRRCRRARGHGWHPPPRKACRRCSISGCCAHRPPARG